MTDREAIERLIDIVSKLTMSAPAQREVEELREAVKLCACAGDWTDGTTHCQECGRLRA